MLTNSANQNGLETATALYVLDVLDLRTAALVSGCSQDEIQAAVRSPVVEAECLRLQADNRVTELRASFGLDAVVERLVVGISTLDSQAGLIRTGEFLHRVSGLQERRAAARSESPDKPRFSMAIVLHNEDGTTRTIRIGGGGK